MDLCGDGSVFKKVLSPGAGALCPRGAKVAVHYRGRLAGGAAPVTYFDDSRSRGVRAARAAVRGCAKSSRDDASQAL